MQYAEMLRHSLWAAKTHASQLVEHAYQVSSFLWNDNDVTKIKASRETVKFLINLSLFTRGISNIRIVALWTPPEGTPYGAY